MKIATLLTAAAFVLASGAIVDAAQPRKGMKPHKYRAHTMVRQQAERPRDPYGAYWNDPSRNQFPSWGLTGN